MKKFLLVLIIAVFTTGVVFSEEISTGFDWDIRFGVSFPYVSNFGSFLEGDDVAVLRVGAGIISPLLFSSLSLGLGFQYTIVPHILAPGIYTDIHFSVLPWFFVGIFSDWQKTFLLLQPGVRFYNQFQFTESFGVEPFFGYNFMYINILDNYKESHVLMNAGFVLKIGDSFGFEYCYIIPNNIGGKKDWVPSVHRFGFSWSLRSRS